ncbi:MAG TPA: translation initiation factor [Bacteroidota bacterium]
MKLKSFSDLSQLLPPSGKSEHAAAGDTHDGKGKTARISLDTKGRKGKAVTVISGLQHNPETLKEIARILKEHCATGGTVKEGAIELQGDQRVRATEKLKKMNYAVTKS